MNYIKLISILFVSSVFTFYSCGNKNSAVKDKARAALEVSKTPVAPSTPSTPTKEPAQNAEGVWHYTCPNGCNGGAGVAGPCAICGGTLTHNTAYHPQKEDAPIATTSNTITPLATGTGTPPNTAPPSKPAEPAQNASGVWHYTCGNGCAGGAGAAGPCGTCGGMLAHNTAYH